MRITTSQRLTAAVGAVTIALTLAACSSSSTAAPASSADAAAAATALGTPKGAGGSPVLFGMITQEASVGNFPEARQSAEAAIAYVNAYRGGLDGHPIQLKTCVTDGSAATSKACANQLIAAHPVAILGAADLSAAVTLPLYAKAGLASFGGLDITPPTLTAPNSLIFSDVALGGFASEAVFMAKQLKARKVGAIVVGDPAGAALAKGFVYPVLAKYGVSVKQTLLAPSVADATAAVANAVSGSPDVFFVFSPSQCVSILSSLKKLGNTKPIVTVDPCSTPAVFKASSGANAGAYFNSPFQPPTAKTADVQLYTAILDKYAPKAMLRDSGSQEGVQTVMNIWSTFNTTPVAKLTSDYMMTTLKAGNALPNFMGTPYTCDGKAAPMFPGLCNAVQYFHQVMPNGTVVQPSDTKWDGLADLTR